MMASGDFEGAWAIFTGLGLYGDSEALASECLKNTAYNKAVALMGAERYRDAVQELEPLAAQGFEDSSNLLTLCRNKIVYNEAVALMMDGRYEDAAIMLEPLAVQGFEDSSYLVSECGNEIAYAEAVALVREENYTGAIALLEPLTAQGFKDSAALLNECDCNIDYSAADAAYNAGRYYEAYKVFISLGDFKDANRRAGLCTREYPSTGEVFRDRDYSGTNVALRIETPSDDRRPTFVKIYSEDGVHISSIFINGGDSPRVRIPAGTYMIRAAYGSDWFGFEDMFGDNGVYQTLLFEGNATTIRLQRNHEYTLTLRNAANGNVGTQNGNRGSF